MNTKLDVEIFAIAVGVSGESGIGSIGHHVEIVSETDIIYLPVTASILFNQTSVSSFSTIDPLLPLEKAL
jgi:hypothetical protein